MTRRDTLEVDAERYGSLTEAIVLAVAAVRNERPVELESLYDAVDPDALERLCSGASSVTATFEYAGVTVSVTADHRVLVNDVEGPLEAPGD